METSYNVKPPRIEICTSVTSSITKCVLVVVAICLVLVMMIKRSKPYREKEGSGCADIFSSMATVTRGPGVEKVPMVDSPPLGFLYVQVFLRGQPSVFFVDTGWAGPPLVNTWHEGREGALIKQVGVDKWNTMSLADKVKMLADKPYEETTDAVQAFVDRHSCETYASSCTMRLAGIASTTDRVMDMILCPALDASKQKKAATGETRPDADLLMTIHNPGVPHIMTVDYLLSYGTAIFDFTEVTSPVLIMGDEELKGSSEWMSLPTSMLYGSFSVELVVQGRRGKFTLDSGSAAPIVLGRTFSQNITTIPSETKFVKQVGVNGEVTCSTIVPGIEVLAGNMSVRVPALLSDQDTDGVEGYIGLNLMKKWGKVGITKDAVWIPPTSLRSSINSSIFDGVSSINCSARKLRK